MSTWHVLYSAETNQFRFVYGRKYLFKDGAVGDGGIYYAYIGVY